MIFNLIIVAIIILIGYLIRKEDSRESECGRADFHQGNRAEPCVPPALKVPEETGPPGANAAERPAAPPRWWYEPPRRVGKLRASPQICPFKPREQWSNEETAAAWAELTEDEGAFRYWRDVARMVACEAQREGLSGISLWTHARSLLAKRIEGDAEGVEAEDVKWLQIAELFLREVVV